MAARSATLLLLALLAMLFADKRALETNLKVGLLQIREKELNFYTQNCLAVCTQAALLAGFAYSGLTQVSIPEEANFWVRLLYISVTVMAMCFEIIAVLNTTLLAIVGPGLALRGPDGSMHPAVDGMMAEYKHALSCFKLGLVCFHLSAGLFGWIMFGCAPPPAAPAAAPPAAARAPRRTDPPPHHPQGASRSACRWLCSCRSTFCCGTRCACTSASVCRRTRWSPAASRAARCSPPPRATTSTSSSASAA